MAATWKKIAFETDVIAKALLTEQGDIIYASGVGTPAALPHGTSGQALISGGHAANPSWGSPTAAAHAASHQSGGGDAIKIDDLAAGDDNTDLDVSTSKHGLAPKAVAPASGLMNVFGIANGETAIANKALFDATAPSTQAFGDAAAAGTAMAAARRDHKHAMPADPAAANAILKSLLTEQGDIIYAAAAATPAALPHGTSGQALLTQGNGANPIWGTPTPAAHAASHKNSGSDELLLSDLGEPTGAVEFNGQQAQNLVGHTVANAAARPTAAVGKIIWQTDELCFYACTAVA